MKANFFIFLIFIGVHSYGQLQIVDSLKVSNIQHLSVDRSGEIYLGDFLGNVIKYSSDLEELARFSPTRKGTISVLDPWNPLRIFVGYNDIQEYIFLDHFLVNENRFSLDKVSTYVGVSAPSLDNNLWLIDYTDFSLKKYNIAFDEVEIIRSFDLLLNPDNYSITHLREYQNLLFLCDEKSGILIFDNLANYLYTIKGVGIGYLSFWNSKLYYKEGNKLKIVDLYTDERKQVNLSFDMEKIISTEKHYFFLTKKWLYRARKP